VHQTGRFFDGGSSNIGWVQSGDSGVTWTYGFLPGTTVYATPPGTYDRISDPAVAYDARHNVWMVASLALRGTTGEAVLISRSTNGGTQWGNPVTVSTAGGGFYDKEWVACDNHANSPYYGNCYTEWDDAYAGNRFYMSVSSDGGATWGPRRSPSGQGGLGGQPLALPNGFVVVPSESVFGSEIVFYSSNGGTTWSGTSTISSASNHAPAGGLRESPLPSADVDDAGRIYVVWADCRFRSNCSANDIVMSTTTNGRWSPVARIPIDATNSNVDHFIPGIAVQPGTSGANARIAISYYYYPVANCSFSTCQLTLGGIISTDGGATWQAPQLLGGPMNLADLANTNQGRMVGDYISTSWSGGLATTVAAIATQQINGTFHEDMYAASYGPMLAPARPVEYAPVLWTTPSLPQIGPVIRQ
jgi:hypothetical protein